ncbi:MAG: hypothetical protein RL220_972 [Bacteroidota bacterium]
MKSLTFTSLLLMSVSLVLFTGCKSDKQVAQGEGASGKGGMFQKKMLESVTITSITINYVSMYGADGEKWDSWAPGSENPDIYALLKFRDQEMLRTNTVEDLAFGVTSSFDFVPVTLGAWNSEHVLYVYDEDGVSDDDNVGYFSFIPSDYEKKDEIVLGSREGSVQITMKLTWNYISK